MQGVSINTPVSKCLDLAAYAARMMSKFPDNAPLVAIAAKMTAGAAELVAAQQAYEAAVDAILPARVDVKYENYVSDRRIRLTQQKAEIADGKRGGRVAGLVFPEGSATITRLLGPSQVEEMENLEGRLGSVEASWAEASAEKTDIGKARQAYQAALEGRRVAGQKARDLRAARNAAKEKFVTMYATAMSGVEGEFPRDKVTQDLFFDEVRTKSAREAADEDGEGEGAGEGEPG
jgi:hypothetical protein